MAKVVGKICDLLEPYSQAERQKIFDTVTTLAMASRPSSVTTTEAPPQRLPVLPSFTYSAAPGGQRIA
jgi:hypothetical protein